MVEYSKYKTIQCRQGHLFVVPFQTTIATCPVCESIVMVYFHKTIIDKNGNYVY